MKVLHLPRAANDDHHAPMRGPSLWSRVWPWLVIGVSVMGGAVQLWP